MVHVFDKKKRRKRGLSKEASILEINKLVHYVKKSLKQGEIDKSLT
jgi:hypothetical protein